MTEYIDPVTGEPSAEKESATNGTSKGGTVHNIAEAKAKRKRKEGINRNSVLRQYLKVMLGDPFAFAWPEFPEKLIVVSGEDSSRLPALVNEGNEIQYVRQEYVEQALLRYSELVILSYGQDFGLKVSDSKDIAKMWLANSNPVPDHTIVPVAFKSDSNYTYRKLDFDPDPELPTPVFDELFGRIDNRAMVLAWFGSLFVKNSSRQNYLWLHGTGGQGKSSISLFFKRVLGKAYGSFRVPYRGEERFWTSGLLGIRLATFPDCNEAGFVTTSLFKQITGGDAVSIEFKHGNPSSRELSCKCFYISNNRPNISGLHAEVRRLILGEIAPLAEGTELLPQGVYLAKLWAERAGFIGKAIEAYREVFKADGDLSKAQVKAMIGLDELIEENEAEFTEAFDDYFLVDPKGAIPAKAISELARKLRWPNFKTKKFYEYLERKKPFIKRYCSNGERGIRGITYRNKDKFYAPEKPDNTHDLSKMDDTF